jgi:hypothetical protein
MAKALRLVVMVLCLGMIALPYVNATSGFYSHEGTQMKYIWSKVLAGECDERTIANDFEDDGKSPCVTNLGFASQDLVPIIIGLLVLILQFRKLMSPEDKPVKSTRFAKAKMVIGVTFFVVIIADWSGLLSPNGEMMDWAMVVGAPLPNAMFHGIFAVVGLQSYKKGRAEYDVWKEERVTIATEGEMNVQEALFNRPMQNVFGRDASTRGADRFRTVGELRTHMGIDHFEDSFDRALADRSADVSEKPCHYCNGEGCGICTK